MAVKTDRARPSETPAPEESETPVVHVTFVMDRTGSMEAVRSDVIGGFNSFLADQRRQPGECLFTVHQFDSEGFDTLFEAKPIGEVRDATEADFVPRAWTPLYDAIGRAVTATQKRLDGLSGNGAAREKQLVVIFTDGLENASREFTRERIFELIRSKEAQGWAFSYLGANQDAYVEGGSMGFARGATQTYGGDPQGTRAAWSSASAMTASYRSRTASGQSLSSDDLYTEVGKDAEKDWLTRAK